MFIGSFVIVDSGHVIRTLCAVKPRHFPEGFHFKKPFIDKVEQMGISLLKHIHKPELLPKTFRQLKLKLQYNTL